MYFFLHIEPSKEKKYSPDQKYSYSSFSKRKSVSISHKYYTLFQSLIICSSFVVRYYFHIDSHKSKKNFTYLFLIYKSNKIKRTNNIYEKMQSVMEPAMHMEPTIVSSMILHTWHASRRYIYIYNPSSTLSKVPKVSHSQPSLCFHNKNTQINLPSSFLLSLLI